MPSQKLRTLPAINPQDLQELWGWIRELLSLWSLIKVLRDIRRYISRLAVTLQSYAVARVYLAQIVTDSLFCVASKSEDETRQHMDSLSQTLNKIGKPDFITDERFWSKIRDMRSTVSIFGPKFNADSTQMEWIKVEQFDTFTPSLERAVKLYESYVNDLKSLFQRSPRIFLKLIFEYQFRQNSLYHILQSVSQKSEKSGETHQFFH